MNFSLSQLLRWLILTLLFPIVFLNFWLASRLFQSLQPVVTILLLATLLAFILNFPVSILQRQGVKRNYAVALVFIIATVVFIALGIILLPIVLEQFNEMVKVLPQWIDSSEEKLEILSHWFSSHKLNVNFRQVFTKVTDQLPNELEFISDKLLSIIIDTIDNISEALIIVVLAFYLLLDGPRIWEGLFNRLPGSFAPKVSQSIQLNFQNYLIGQGTLALLMGFSETLVFLVFQVQFALLFGLGVGLLSLIPFGDVVSLIVITLIIASHNFWLAVKVFLLAVVIDQFIDQAIAPRLLGKFTGIRPIWVLIALLVGTNIGGVLGLLIAVPVAGFIKDAAEGFSKVGDFENAVEAKPPSELLAEESISQ
ncbi:MAG: AI-2E family transporter [Nostoc sp. GBBB01]|jgi:predicted PurR-regulated permease PerM|uniref:AI-2E family transporter n=1 Tax=Nostoc punctiforme FACHB-252 TaxID=1357509 RepID=A0ABR8H655_NOSPU|nr:AI-2E family transporter [Nostoc punctiforme]MBD2611297.1 AI-2E family transporter [Nostoc punctiforme FACHB-252]MBL1199757.1 AI-2E family transporter [Nostoc sp. GBBB01]